MGFRDLNFRITHQYSRYDKSLVLKILHDLSVLLLVTPRKIYSLRAVPSPYLLQPLFVVQLDDVEDKIWAESLMIEFDSPCQPCHFNLKVFIRFIMFFKKKGGKKDIGRTIIFTVSFYSVFLRIRIFLYFIIHISSPKVN